MNKSNWNERRFDFQVREAVIEGQEPEQWAEGYAAVLNNTTVLFESDGIEYKERIAPDAFVGCKMDDVIFNYNHCGRVLARTRNKTLQLMVDERGLMIRAKLNGTADGRSLYDEIKNGYIDRMSYRYVSDDSYDTLTHTWTVLRVKRIYDVSAVDIPAYDDTSIEARKSVALEADAQVQKLAAEAALAKRRLQIKLKLTGG